MSRSVAFGRESALDIGRLGNRLGRELGVEVRVSRTSASQMWLKIGSFGQVRLGMPDGSASADARHFVLSQREWLLETSAGLSRRRPFRKGDILEVFGRRASVVEAETSPPCVRSVKGRVTVAIPRRTSTDRSVATALGLEAARYLTRTTALKAARLGLPPPPIRIVDTRSTWATCTCSGILSFTWRVALCPRAIVDYLAAHEVAHLVDMGHGAAFWDLCRSISVMDPRRADAWLDANQQAIMGIGPRPGTLPWIWGN